MSEYKKSKRAIQKWRDKNREEYNAYLREYRRKNRAKINARRRELRAAKAQNEKS